MILRLKDLCKFYNCSMSTATRIKQDIHFCLKHRKKHLTLLDLSKYEGCTIKEIQDLL